MDRPLLDELLQTIIAIGVIAATYQTWKAKQAAQRVRRSVDKLHTRLNNDDECLNAVHCECCPANDR